MTPYHTVTREHAGHTITLSWHYDPFMGPPWEEHDGHGPVSEWTRRDKWAGELVLCEDRSRKRFYDYAGACRIALRDGWDSLPYNTGQETKRQQAAKAARADFEHLRQWCNNQWHWSCYTVEIDGFDYNKSCWGIESTSIRETTTEAFASAVEWLDRELMESEAMAARDIVTA